MSFWNKMEKPAFDSLPPTAPQPTAETPTPPPPTREPPATREPPVREPVTREPPPRATAPAAPPPAPQAAPPRNSDHLRVGRGVRLEGKLTFAGTVRVEAFFQGAIVTDGVLVVGEGAKVNAQITAGSLVVEGEVNGNVKAKEAVELTRTAVLRGEVETPSLSIDRGAVFEGVSRRPGSAASASPGKAAAAPAPSAH